MIIIIISKQIYIYIYIYTYYNNNNNNNYCYFYYYKAWAESIWEGSSGRAAPPLFALRSEASQEASNLSPTPDFKISAGARKYMIVF